MSSEENPARRKFVREVGSGSDPDTPGAGAPDHGPGRERPLLSPNDPAAVKVKYTEDATQQTSAKGNKCATCGLYEGAYGSTQGPLPDFSGQAGRGRGLVLSLGAAVVMSP